MIGDFTGERASGLDTQRGEQHMKVHRLRAAVWEAMTGAEIPVMWLPAKEHQELLVTIGNWEQIGRILQREHGPQISGLEIYKT